MMMNLFSSFDPSTNMFNLSINWLSSIIGVIMIPQLYWLTMPRLNVIWMKLSLMMHNELKILLKNKNKGSTLLFFSIFSLILFNNFMGLFPYIFTSTSHLTMTLTLALPMWVSFMMFGWINKMNHMFTHLVPQSTPFILMPFMVLIETISNLIRAITLSVRLSANMIAGHLLMTLMSNLGVSTNFSLTTLLIFMQTILLSLESAVAIIQSYVFMVLTTLYSSEIN